MGLPVRAGGGVATSERQLMVCASAPSELDTRTRVLHDMTNTDSVLASSSAAPI